MFQNMLKHEIGLRHVFGMYNFHELNNSFKNWWHHEVVRCKTFGSAWVTSKRQSLAWPLLFKAANQCDTFLFKNTLNPWILHYVLIQKNWGKKFKSLVSKEQPWVVSEFKKRCNNWGIGVLRRNIVTHGPCLQLHLAVTLVHLQK